MLAFLPKKAEEEAPEADKVERLDRLEEDEPLVEEAVAAGTPEPASKAKPPQLQLVGEDALPTTFAPLWRELRDRGWTYARGKGLVSWCWLKPGKTVKTGKRGEDYFESEADLMRHVLGDAAPATDDLEVEGGKRRRVKAPERFEVTDFRSEDAVLSDHGSDYGSDGEGARPKKKRTTAEHPKAAANKRPKRARNSYAYYVSHAIGALRAAEPSAARGELMQRAQEAWKVMDVAARRPFEQQAAEDKQRFDREIAAFHAAAGTTAGAGRGVAGLLCRRIVIPAPLPPMAPEQRVLVSKLEACLNTKLDEVQLKQILAAMPLEKPADALSADVSSLGTMLELCLEKIDFKDHPMAYRADAPKVDVAKALGAVKYLVAAQGRGLLL